MLEFFSGDTLRIQSKTITVEIERSFQIIDTKRNESYTRLHAKRSNAKSSVR